MPLIFLIGLGVAVVGTFLPLGGVVAVVLAMALRRKMVEVIFIALLVGGIIAILAQLVGAVLVFLPATASFEYSS